MFSVSDDASQRNKTGIRRGLLNGADSVTDPVTVSEQPRVRRPAERRRVRLWGKKVHIEPGIVNGAKIALSSVAAAGRLLTR